MSPQIPTGNSLHLCNILPIFIETVPLGSISFKANPVEVLALASKHTRDGVDNEFPLNTMVVGI